MQAVILNGAHRSDTSLENAYALVQEQLALRHCRVTPFVVQELNLDPCDGDLHCWFQNPGLCKHSGAVNNIAYSVIHSDLTILLTPIMNGGYSSELTRIIDYLVSLISPLLSRVKGQIRHSPRYARYPRLLAFGMLPAPSTDCESRFADLIGCNAANLHAPAYQVAILYSNQHRHEIRTTIAHGLERLGASG